MSTETAQLVLGLIAGVGFLVWLAGLQFLLASARAGRPSAPPPGDQPDALPANLLLGSAEVAGQPTALVKRAAALLAKQGAASFGTVKIVECTDDRLVFERVGAGVGNLQQANGFRRGELRFTAQSRERTRVDYAIEGSSLRWLLRVGAVFLLLGLLMLTAGYWILYTLVATSPNENLRWQTIQMGQVIHLLWPPFLFGFLYRRGTQNLRAGIEAFVANLPYAE